MQNRFKLCWNSFGDIELVPVGIDDGDHLVHIRCRWQVLGEDEEISAQHEGGGIEGGEVALQAQRQQKSKLATTVNLVHENISQFFFCASRLVPVLLARAQLPFSLIFARDSFTTVSLHFYAHRNYKPRIISSIPTFSRIFLKRDREKTTPHISVSYFVLVLPSMANKRNILYYK